MVEESSPVLPPAEESIEAETDTALAPEPESGEPTPDPASEPGFGCDCEFWMRSACKGLPFYEEHASKRYCVLHYPGNEKGSDFKAALDAKLKNKEFDFRGVWFPDQVDFCGFEFSAAADFSSATFSAPVHFRSATFSADANFSDAKFSADANFSHAKFSAPAHSRSARFYRTVDFSSATFSATVHFDSATFSADASFGNATFKADAHFSSTMFSADVFFSAARFSYAGSLAPAYFDSATFSAAAHFHSATFSAAALFDSATFSAAALFDSATFSAYARFRSARFSADADFRSATFSASAEFTMAAFNAAVDFSRAIFSEAAGLNEAVFSGAVLFDESVFHSRLDFGSASFNDAFHFFGSATERKLKGGTRLAARALGEDPSLDFQHVRIEHPERIAFHTLNLRPHWFVNVDPRQFVFTDVGWEWERISIKQEIAALEANEVSSPNHLLAIACRQLAENAEANNRYEEASRFRYWAMDLARRTKWKGWSFWKTDWLHMLYWAVSGYGERILRALGVLAAVWIVFVLLYTCVGFVPQLASDQAAASATAASTTIENRIGQPLELTRALTYSLAVMSLQKPEPKPLTGTAQTLVLLETILGPVQAALLALAIRRKFMR